MRTIIPSISFKDYKAAYPDRRRSDWLDLSRLNVSPYTASIGNGVVLNIDLLNAYALFVVTLSVTPIEPVNINFATRDGTAKARRNDYTPASGVLTFWPGQTIKDITVPYNRNNKKTSLEFFVDIFWSKNSSNLLGLATGSVTLMTFDTVDSTWLTADSTLIMTDLQ